MTERWAYNLAVISGHYVSALMHAANRHPDRTMGHALELVAARIDGLRHITNWEEAPPEALMRTARRIDEELRYAFGYLDVADGRRTIRAALLTRPLTAQPATTCQHQNRIEDQTESGPCGCFSCRECSYIHCCDDHDPGVEPDADRGLRLRLFPALPGSADVEQLHRRVVRVPGAWLLPGTFRMHGRNYLLALAPPYNQLGWSDPESRDATEDDIVTIESEIVTHALDGDDAGAELACMWFVHVATARLRVDLRGDRIPHYRVDALVDVLEAMLRRMHDKARADAPAPWGVPS